MQPRVRPREEKKAQISTYRPAAVSICLVFLILLAAPVAAPAGDGDESDAAKWKLQLNAGNVNSI